MNNLKALSLAAVAALPVVFACNLGSKKTSTAATLTIESGRLLDVAGNERLFRGVNARVEGLFDVTFDDGRTALQPIPPFGEADCAFIARELGHNLLRLPVNWSGIEPERGAYNDAYLARVLAVLDFCAPYDVMVLVDLHQDAYSKEIGEDGAPLWAIEPPPEQLLEGPLEDLAERRLSGQVAASFESLFDNKNGLRDAYAAMAAHLALAIKDHPNLLGLEIMNEPILYGKLDRLDDFHDAVAAKVRDVAPDLALFFEPNALRNFQDKVDVRRPVAFDRAVYAPHLYTGVFQSDWQIGQSQRIADSVAGMVDEAAAHAAGVLVGEFGNNPQELTGATWLRDAFAAMDAEIVSWAFWVYEEWSQGSWGLYDAVTAPTPARLALRESAADLLARAYPSRVQGRLKTVVYDVTSKELRVELTPSGSRHQVALPERHYGQKALLFCAGQELEIPIENGRADIDCAEQDWTLVPFRP